ncbi:MAG: hypothetical protein DCC55_28485 [Chloroflexi bacterium]|nr:MAG: hypothetical protein DCC55_28485 [Chloroflexota bacterium]
MSLILSAVATVIIALTGFADHNSNWALDAGEQLAGGAYEVYYTAPDGAVAMVMVSLIGMPSKCLKASMRSCLGAAV